MIREKNDIIKDIKIEEIITIDNENHYVIINNNENYINIIEDYVYS
jgi:hypothetical protein